MKQSAIGNTEIFRQYDVRGVYGTSLDESVALRIGTAYGSLLDSKATVVVGRDARESSSSLSGSLVKGLTGEGCNVLDIGMVPVPVLYHAVKHLMASGGVMTTASHLPAGWNGFKFSGPDGIVLSEGSGLEDIRKRFIKPTGKNRKAGTYTIYANSIADYTREVARKITMKPSLKIAFDYGNSVTSLVIPGIMKHFGIDIIELNTQVKAIPDRQSELTSGSLNSLKEEVLRSGCDAGVGYDGDGDRVAFVDEAGNIYPNGNTSIAIFAEYLLRRSKGGSIVFDVPCSRAVEDVIKANGGTPVVIRSGHSYNAIEVRKRNALFGGQYSGHLSFPEMGCSDDAIYASLLMLQILSEGKSFSELLSRFPRYHQAGMLGIPCPDSQKSEVIKEVYNKVLSSGFGIDVTDGVKLINVKALSWVLIRASNTEPLIRVNAEGPSRPSADKMMNIGVELVKEVISNHHTSGDTGSR